MVRPDRSLAASRVKDHHSPSYMTGGDFRPGQSGITDLIQQLLRTVPLHGLASPFDKTGFQVHNVLTVGPAPQADRQCLICWLDRFRTTVNHSVLGNTFPFGIE